MDGRKQYPLPSLRAPPLLPLGPVILILSVLGSRRQRIDRIEHGRERAQGEFLGQVNRQYPLVLRILSLLDAAAKGLLGLDDIDLLVWMHVHAPRR